jgi:hypothetical protein
MYGLLYPAILGAVGVFTLQKLETGAIDYATLAVAVTAGAFFTLSFASAYQLEREYLPIPFLIDVVEIVEVWLCFSLLNIAEPEPEWLKQLAAPLPNLSYTYALLLVALLIQIGWRWAMGLKWYAFADLKGALLIVVVVGVFHGTSMGAYNWILTALFSALATLYVAAHPYGKAAGRVLFVWPNSASE